MDIVGGEKYDHQKEDCPRVLSAALQLKYSQIPTLGCTVSNLVLMTSLRSGLKKHGMKLNLIYSTTKKHIDEAAILPLLVHLLTTRKDGFMVLKHTNTKQIRHIVAFLYNEKHNTLDFFDSYNKTRTLYTLRLNKKHIAEFVNDFFHKYFEDEFVIEKLFEFIHL